MTVQVQTNQGMEASGVNGDNAAARRLCREFSAPVGLLDPTTLVWRVRQDQDASKISGR